MVLRSLTGSAPPPPTPMYQPPPNRYRVPIRTVLACGRKPVSGGVVTTGVVVSDLMTGVVSVLTAVSGMTFIVSGGGTGFGGGVTTVVVSFGVTTSPPDARSFCTGMRRADDTFFLVVVVRTVVSVRTRRVVSVCATLGTAAPIVKA